MTSVLLITFLSQARIFLAMARDGLMPRNIFAAVHERYRTRRLIAHDRTFDVGALTHPRVVGDDTTVTDAGEVAHDGFAENE